MELELNTAVKSITINEEFEIQDLLDIGTMLIAKRRHKQAMACFDLVLKEDPNQIFALSNMGICWMNLGEVKKGIRMMGEAIALQPDFSPAWLNIGNGNLQLEELGHARFALDICAQLGGSIEPEAWMTKALMFQRGGDTDAAILAYQKALTLNPEHTAAKTFLGMMLLQKGDYAMGAPLYEFRLHMNPPWLFRSPSCPIWDGKPVDLKGKKVLVMSEQGIGDGVQFCRYLPWLKEQGADISFHVFDSSIPLMKEFWPDVKLFPASKRSLPMCEMQIALASLPFLHMLHGGAYARELALPEGAPPPFPEKLRRIGICWRGNPNHPNDKYRSMKLVQMLPLLHAFPDVTFVPLQQDLTEVEEELLRTKGGAATDFPVIDTWDQTLDVIKALDYVITVDTSFLHVAGTLGKYTTLLLAKHHDWRWGQDHVSPRWYWSVTPVKQTKLGDWADVMAAVVKYLDPQKGTDV